MYYVEWDIVGCDHVLLLELVLRVPATTMSVAMPSTSTPIHQPLLRPRFLPLSVCAILPKDALTFLSQDAANNQNPRSTGDGEQQGYTRQYSGQPSARGGATVTDDGDDQHKEEVEGNT